MKDFSSLIGLLDRLPRLLSFFPFLPPAPVVADRFCTLPTLQYHTFVPEFDLLEYSLLM